MTASALDADRAAAEAFDDRREELAVDLVEAEFVDFEHLQRVAGDRDVDLPFALAPRRNRARGAAGGWRCAACRASGGRSRASRRSVTSMPRMSDERRTMISSESTS